MSEPLFTLREITRRAGGGEIARTATLGGGTQLVGRGSDCAVRIADLAVMLHHVRLTALGAGIVLVEAVGAAPLRVDGRFASRVEVKVERGAALALGSHQLTIAAGVGPGEIVLTVERVAAAFDAEAADERAVFGVGAVLPEKRVLAWALLIAVLGFGLAWPIWAHFSQPKAPVVQSAQFRPDVLWTSGPLSRAHAGLANNCGACHDQAFVTVRDASCRTCHARLPDHAPLATMQQAQPHPRGIVAETQAKVAAAAHVPVGRCAACHTEHEGPDGALMVAASFCGDCHAGLQARLPGTQLLNARDFVAPGGHPQFRPTLVVQPSNGTPQLRRLSLDERPRERSGLVFPHRLHVEGGGAAARMAQAAGTRLDCAACHVADAAGVRFRKIEMERDCGECHDLAFDRDRAGTVRRLPHGKPAEVVATLRAFYAAEPGWAGFRDRRRPGLVPPLQALRGVDAKVRATFARDGACYGCHAVIAPARGLDFRVAPVSVTDHYLPKARFPHDRHRTTACATCHAAAASDRSEDVLLPGIATCRECHGNSQAKLLAPATCQTCHGFHGVEHRSAKPAPLTLAQNGQAWPPPGAGSHGTPRSSEATTGNSVNTGS